MIAEYLNRALNICQHLYLTNRKKPKLSVSPAKLIPIIVFLSIRPESRSKYKQMLQTLLILIDEVACFHLTLLLRLVPVIFPKLHPFSTFLSRILFLNTKFIIFILFWEEAESILSYSRLALPIDWRVSFFIEQSPAGKEMGSHSLLLLKFDEVSSE
jgi:hypothetical protein